MARCRGRLKIGSAGNPSRVLSSMPEEEPRVLPELPRDLYRHPGPFASVYLDASRSHEDAAHEIELRWKELATSLHEQGADAATVAVLEKAVVEPTGQAGTTGRAVFAAHGKVRLDVTLPDVPRRHIARWAPLPHVLPMLAQTPARVPYVLVELGKTAATVCAVDAEGRTWADVHDRGREQDTHKPRGGATAHQGIQQRVEEQWKANLRDFASTVEQAVARLPALLLVVSGEVQARAMFLDELGGRSREIAVEWDGPNPDDTTTRDNVLEQVRPLVAERAAERSRPVLDELRAALGRDTGLAVTGLREVVRALQQGQVETLAMVDDPSGTDELWVGPQAWELAGSEAELTGLGAEVLGRDRADAALVRAVAGTGARLVLLPHPAAAGDPARAGSAAGAQGTGPGPEQVPEMADGVGAVLRYSTPDE